MSQAVLLACLPWAICLAACVAIARFLLRASGARLCLARLKALHTCQEGGVQSLSFVLTLPVFIMIMMLIVQVSQIMIGTVLVHYAAFASARSAVVWVPANAGWDEPENCIHRIHLVPQSVASNVSDPVYQLTPGGRKHQKIHQAAVLACLPLAPSRSLGDAPNFAALETAHALAKVYLGLSPSSAANTRIPDRLANKLTYSFENTEVDVQFTHRMGEPHWNREPPLRLRYFTSPYPEEFQWNEVGWRDVITVTVTHHMALLPGPGRLLARPTHATDAVSQGIQQRRGTYVWPISATATLGNEGEKPLKTYRQVEFQTPGAGGF